MHHQWISTIKITFIATYVALTYGLQIALAPLPNVETVTLFLLVAAVQLPLSLSVLTGLAFIFLEALTYGFGDWVLFYVVSWTVLIAVSFLLRPLILRWWGFGVFIGTFFGFLFGTIDALIKGCLYGLSGMLAYWTSGLFFDFIHGISNFFVILFCYLPMSRVVAFYTLKFFNSFPDLTSKKWGPVQNFKLWFKLCLVSSHE